MKLAGIILLFLLASCTTSKTAVVSIKLDGAKSYDPDGYIAKWSWRQLSGPTVVIKNKLSDTTHAETSDKEASYSFELMVTDNKGAIDKDTVTIEYKKKSPKMF